jgi:hypothetical protein
MSILLNKKNIQGLLIAERVNYDFVKATQDDIICVKLNNENKRTLIQTKVKNKRLKKKGKKEYHFFNQITVVIRVFYGIVKDWDTEPKINLKLFKNGSIQI